MKQRSTKPNEKRNFYYSFDYNWIHVTVMSIKENYSVGSDQYKWIENDLRQIHIYNFVMGGYTA